MPGIEVENGSYQVDPIGGYQCDQDKATGGVNERCQEYTDAVGEVELQIIACECLRNQVEG